MELLLTIKRDKRKVFCGYIYFWDNILIEHGRSYTEIKEKMAASLQNMYEISPGVIQFQTRSHHIMKAIHVIRRLKKEVREGDLEVSFNSEYFI